jgi:hypothetical protein
VTSAGATLDELARQRQAQREEAAEKMRVDSRPLAELIARGEQIVRDVRGFDIDTRADIDLTLRNLKDGLDPAKDEQTLREQIGRAEMGDSLSDLSDINPKAVEAARAYLDALNVGGLPDFVVNSMITILETLAERTGAGIWR